MTGTTWRERGERERIVAIFVLQCFCIVASSCTNSQDPRNDTWKIQAPLATAAAAATRKDGRSDETGRADGLTDWLTEWSVLERKGGSFQGGFAERRRNSWNKNEKPKPNREKFKSTIFKLWSTHQILGAGDTIAEDQRIHCFFCWCLRLLAWMLHSILLLLLREFSTDWVCLEESKLVKFLTPKLSLSLSLSLSVHMMVQYSTLKRVVCCCE